MRKCSLDQRRFFLVEGRSCECVCLVRVHSASGNEQLTQNWYGPGESDCLIKTKHCDGDNFVLTQCDFCPVL